MRRCACGYPERHHHPVTLRCPLCQCGEPTAVHMPHTTPPAVTREAVKGVATHYVCPLRAGTLRAGTFREPEPEPKVMWHGLTVPAPAIANKAEPDRVPRREAMRLDEIAPAALKVGAKARAAAVDVVPYFRELPGGAWWCILRMERGVFRAIAIWRRPVGGKWAFLSAAVDRVPVGAKRLGELLSELGEQGRS